MGYGGSRDGEDKREVIDIVVIIVIIVVVNYIIISFILLISIVRLTSYYRELEALNRGFAILDFRF